jgi:putative ABC transport system permease protein
MRLLQFVVRMAWRESRAAWLRLTFFFLCVGLGVASIVVLRSVVQEVRRTLTGEARALVAADVIAATTRPFTDDQVSRIEAVGRANGAVETQQLIDTQTMASAGGDQSVVKLVELRGVEAGYPFYGVLELTSGEPYSHDLLVNGGAVVQPELLAILDIDVGDTLRLAGRDFEVRAAIARDRAQRGGIALGPRVYVDLADLRETSLLDYGSRANYQVLLKVASPDRTAPVVEALRQALREDIVNVRSWETLEDRIGRNLETAENYLSLVGFAIVVLGGIGVWSVTRVLVQQKIRSVAVLKCLGAPGASVLLVSLVQILGLALIGSLTGVVFAEVVLGFLPVSMLESLGVSTAHLAPSAAVQGVAVGLLVSLLFALVPLLEIRQVKPLLLLRAGATSEARRRDWTSWAAGLVTTVALVLVAVWQAGDLETGLFVSMGFGIVALLLYGASTALVGLARVFVRSPRFAVRHAAISIGRPGNQTRVILMAVGLGCFFILGVRATQASLLADLTGGISDRSPDFVFIDIQQDQIEGVQQVLAPYVLEPARIMPNMRARVVAVEGRRLRLDSVEAVRDHGRLAREYGLTFRDNLEANEEIVKGAFWSGASSRPELLDGADTEVSIELDAAEDGLDLGDLVRFDAAGVTFTARVTSIRRVAWEDSQSGGFVFVLRPAPAVLRAPHSYVGFAQVPDGTAGGDLQRHLVRAYPNVSVIDVRDIIATIRTIVDNVTLGITVVGVVTLAGGILILVGAVAMTKFQKIYEAAIYRSLGASARLVTAMLAVEYGLLGTLAGLLGATGGVALSWGLSTFLFKIDWQPAPWVVVGGVLASAGLVSVVGVVASMDVLRRKPLATLRSE